VLLQFERLSAENFEALICGKGNAAVVPVERSSVDNFDWFIID